MSDTATMDASSTVDIPNGEQKVMSMFEADAVADDVAEAASDAVDGDQKSAKKPKASLREKWKNAVAHAKHRVNTAKDAITTPVIRVTNKIKAKVDYFLDIPAKVRATMDRISTGEPLSRAEWAAIMAAPLSFVAIWYYACKVAERKTNKTITWVKGQYQSLCESLGLRKDADPVETQAALAKKEADEVIARAQAKAKSTPAHTHASTPGDNHTTDDHHTPETVSTDSSSEGGSDGWGGGGD